MHENIIRKTEDYLPVPQKSRRQMLSELEHS